MFVGAYWSERSESREQAAERLVRFLRGAAAVDASLAAWFLKGRSKAAAATPVAVEPASLASRLEAARRDVGADVMSEVGFGLGLWNGKDVSLAATVGAVSPFVRNSVVLSSDGTLQALGEPALRRLLEVAVETLDPEHAAVTSAGLLQAAGAEDPWEAGLFTFTRGRGVLRGPGGTP